MFARAEPSAAELDVLTDADLLRLLKTGRDEALGVLLRRHSDSLYRFCFHLMANRDDAEDIAQETMARAIVRADDLHSGSAFRSWLFSIARNLSVDTYRSRKRLTPLPEDADSSPVVLYQDSPYERVEAEEEYQTVAQVLAKLAKSHQTVLMMREVEGMSYAEIAERLDISQSAVETLLFRARRRLRDEYRRTAAPVPAFGALGALRGLLSRIWRPLGGSTPVATKVAVGVLATGAVLSAPHLWRASIGRGAASAAAMASGPTAAPQAARSSGTGVAPRAQPAETSLPANPGTVGGVHPAHAVRSTGISHAGAPHTRELVVTSPAHHASRTSNPTTRSPLAPGAIHDVPPRTTHTRAPRAGSRSSSGQAAALAPVASAARGTHANTGMQRAAPPTPVSSSTAGAPGSSNRTPTHSGSVHQGSGGRGASPGAPATHAPTARPTVTASGQQGATTVQATATSVVGGVQATVATTVSQSQNAVATVGSQVQGSVATVTSKAVATVTGLLPVAGPTVHVPSTAVPVPTVRVKLPTPGPKGTPIVPPVPTVSIKVPTIAVPTPHLHLP